LNCAGKWASARTPFKNYIHSDNVYKKFNIIYRSHSFYVTCTFSLILFYSQQPTMGKKVDPKKKSFDEAIITLVIRLSLHYDGVWFTIKELRALLVAGGIQVELTDMQVAMAVRQNNGRLLDDQYEKIRYYRSVTIINPRMPSDQRRSPTLPAIAADYFLSGNEVANIRAYFGSTTLRKNDRTESMPLEDTPPSK
jgi:hypothetical protein